MENFVIKGDVIDYIDGIPVVDDESIRKATSKDSVKMVYRKVKMPKRGTDEKSLRTLFVHAIARIRSKNDDFLKSSKDKQRMWEILSKVVKKNEIDPTPSSVYQFLQKCK